MPMSSFGNKSRQLKRVLSWADFYLFIFFAVPNCHSQRGCSALSQGRQAEENTLAGTHGEENSVQRSPTMVFLSHHCHQRSHAKHNPFKFTRLISLHAYHGVFANNCALKDTVPCVSIDPLTHLYQVAVVIFNMVLPPPCFTLFAGKPFHVL